MSNYFDYLKRLHTKPIRPDDEFPTNNAWIYTGIYETLRQMNGKYQELNLYSKALELSNPKTGVFTRHPEPYRFKSTMTPISHDETIGISMVSFYYATKVQIASYVYKGYFCDIPRYERKFFAGFNLIVVSFYQYMYRVLIGKESERKITKQYPALFPMFFTHRRQYRYLYDVLSGSKPKILNTLAWTSARLLDVATKSVSLLHYMATLRAEQRGCSGFVLKSVRKLMERSIMKKYGARPVEKLLEAYLLDGTGSVDKNHPWLIEISEYYSKKGE